MNSSTGLGKSHLTQAVVHSVLQNAPSTMLHYLTAQQFSAEMVNGIRNKIHGPVFAEIHPATATSAG